MSIARGCRSTRRCPIWTVTPTRSRSSTSSWRMKAGCAIFRCRNRPNPASRRRRDEAVMRLPSTEDMLDAWERGAAKGPVERGVILARLADVEATEEALTALPVGERDRHLLALRAAVFGPRLTGLLACGACGEQLELDFAVDDLCRIAPSAAGELVVADGDYVVWLRLPDSRDLRDAAAAPP